LPDKAVFLDIDGTIVSLDGQGPFDDDLEGIARARARGCRFLICTGRGFGNIPRRVRDAPWIDGIVSGGGAHVEIGGAVLHLKTADIPTLCEASRRFLAEGKQCTFQGGRALFGINKGFSPVPAAEGDKISILREDDFALRYQDAAVEMMTVDKTMGNETREFLERSFDLYEQVRHFDALIKGENKAKGMDLALEALGIPLKHSIAVGDSENDLDMVVHAGAGIAVGNACDELKAAADWVSTPCGEGGLVRALEHLGLV
jgi:hydroxymethylpyrimidine pyrophosphatase-like HAD family hydrolase